MIDNPQAGVVNVGVDLCPSLMGTFNYPPPHGDVKLRNAIASSPKEEYLERSSSMYHFAALPIRVR
jgi:hypothetical protein